MVRQHVNSVCDDNNLVPLHLPWKQFALKWEQVPKCFAKVCSCFTKFSIWKEFPRQIGQIDGNKLFFEFEQLSGIIWYKSLLILFHYIFPGEFLYILTTEALCKTYKNYIRLTGKQRNNFLGLDEI